MTGPPLPFQQPGSNAIGQFVAGVSPVGDIPVFNVWNTIVSQYANSPILTALITSAFAALDQTGNVDNFFDTIFNIDTAVGYGLDLWGRILGVSRVLIVTNVNDFGFAGASPTVTGFNQGPFFSGTLINNNFSLSDASFRTLLYAKALANISDGTIRSLNRILLTLFPGRGNAFVTDNGNMTMTMTFNFALSKVEQAIVTSGILPRPAGVSLSIVQNG